MAHSQRDPTDIDALKAKTLSDFVAYDDYINETMTNHLTVSAKQVERLLMEDPFVQSQVYDTQKQQAKEIVKKIQKEMERCVENVHYCQAYKKIYDQRLLNYFELSSKILNDDPSKIDDFEAWNISTKLMKDVDTENNNKSPNFLAENRYYESYHNDIWSIRTPRGAPPSIGGMDTVDDDIQVSRQEFSNKCPILGGLLVEPVFSKKCKHTFSKEGIMAIINKQRDGAKCPVCSKPIAKEDLQTDHIAARRVRESQTLSSQRQTSGIELE